MSTQNWVQCPVCMENDMPIRSGVIECVNLMCMAKTDLDTILPPIEKLTPKIVDYTTYDTEMRKSMIDKLFFLDKIEAEMFVDYGSADGALFGIIHDIFPDSGYTYVGYDIDLTMNHTAMAKHPFAYFTDNWQNVADQVRTSLSLEAKTCVIANSLIHEVYHYGTDSDVEEFWQRLFTTGFDYIVIRDLCLAESYSTTMLDHDQVRVKADQKHLEDFENIWGSIANPKNLIHFLLKYRYNDNWSREVYENYFPYTLEDVMQYLAKFGNQYEIEFLEQFALPFNVRTVRKDFGIEIGEIKTHMKLILRKKNV